MSDCKRNANIDVLRGVSILLVLLHHFNIAYSLRDTCVTSMLGWDFVHAVVRNGNYGVTMFFVISGYLITSNARQRWGSLAKIPVATFYMLRATRLAVTGIAVFQNRSPMGIPVSFWLINLASLTFWMNILVEIRGWANYALCVLWSSVEEVFYLSFPLLCVALRRVTHLIVFLGIIIAIGPYYRFLHQDKAEVFLYGYFACFDSIAIGCCAALLMDRLRWSDRIARIARIVAASSIAIFYMQWPISQSNVFGVTTIALATAVLLMTAHLKILSLLQSSTWLFFPVRVSGKLSYEIYLFHLVVLGLLRTFFPPSSIPGDPKVILLAGYLLFSIGTSALVARYYAVPISHTIRQRMVADGGR
jgi:peptidoglycan/LPS O-acetylase OafA/YrhL